MKPSFGGLRLVLCALTLTCGGNGSAPPPEPGAPPVPSTPPGRPGSSPPTSPPTSAPTDPASPSGAGGAGMSGPGPVAPEPPAPLPPAGSGAGGAPAPTPPPGGSAGAGGPAADAAAPPPPGSPEPTPPAGPPAASACNATPGPAAATARLAFRPIELVGLPATTGAGKSPGGLTEIRFMPGAPSDFLLTQKGGRLSHFRLEGDRATLQASFQIPGVFAQDDCGLVSFAYDPGFVQNRIIYAAYCTAGNRSKVSRFTFGPTGLAGAADVITFSEPQGTQPWHSVGSLGFDRGGNMWLLHGEFTDASNSQNPVSTLGKLLRLRPRLDQPGFDPAPGNAFPDDPARSPLVYALGFRSPWRAYLDSQGRYLVGDVGNTANEEVNLVTRAGQNFGWNGSRSGTCTGAACTGLSNPLASYRNANDPYEGDDPAAQTFEARAGRAVWVGVQYEDCGNDRYGGAMTGVYLFGDWYTGWVRGAVIDASGAKPVDRSLAIMPNLSAWTQAPDGYLYALRFGAYGTGGLANERPALFRIELAP